MASSHLLNPFLGPFKGKYINHLRELDPFKASRIGLRSFAAPPNNFEGYLQLQSND